jgi:hypothetical protein
VTAKSLGAGMPIAAVVGRADVMDGPHPAASAAPTPATRSPASPPWRPSTRSPRPASSSAPGRRRRACASTSTLRTTASPQVGDVRGLGPMLAIELVARPRGPNARRRRGAAHTAEALVRGLIVLRAGLYGNCVRLLPPLDVSDDELDEGMGGARRRRWRRAGAVAGRGRRAGAADPPRSAMGAGDGTPRDPPRGPWRRGAPEVERRLLIGGAGATPGRRHAGTSSTPAAARWSPRSPTPAARRRRARRGRRGAARVRDLVAAPALPAGRGARGAADWIRARADALARCTTEESGKPLGEAKAEWLSACNYLPGSRPRAPARTAARSRRAPRRGASRCAAAGRRGRDHHRLELPRLQRRAHLGGGAGGRLHRRRAAQRAHPALGDGAGAGAARGGRAGRRRQPRQRRSRADGAASSSTTRGCARSPSPAARGSASCSWTGPRAP